MKKILLSMFALALVPSTMFGFEMIAGENITPAQDLKGDHYIAGSNVSLVNVDGDASVAGNMISIAGDIKEDLNAIGSVIVTKGIIGDDLRAAGSMITIGNNVKGDVIVAGAKVEIAEGVIIDGDLVVAASQLIINGTVKGNAKIKAKSIVIGEKAKIVGGLRYTARQASPALENITTGKKMFTMMDYRKDGKMMNQGGLRKIITGFAIYKFIFLIVFGALFFFLLQGYMKKTAEVIQKTPGRAFLRGLLLFAVAPFVILLLALSIIGLPFAALLAVMYVFLFVLYELMTVIVFTALISNKYLGKMKGKMRYQVLIIILIAALCTLIAGLDIIAGFFAWGALLTMRFKLVMAANTTNGNGTKTATPVAPKVISTSRRK